MCWAFFYIFKLQNNHYETVLPSFIMCCFNVLLQ